MQEATQNQKPQKTPLWLIGFIILALATLGWFAWLAFDAERTKDSQTTTFTKPIPEEVYTLVGEVESTGVKRFTFVALANRNYFAEDRTMTVEIDESTEYLITTAADPATGRLVERRQGTFDDIQIGNQISVVGGDSIKDKETFIATRVEIVK